MKAHICIGGPLHGEFATSADFIGNSGMYAHRDSEYIQFNNAGHLFGKRANRACPSMVWLHDSLLKPPINPKNR